MKCPKCQNELKKICLSNKSKKKFGYICETKYNNKTCPNFMNLIIEIKNQIDEALIPQKENERGFQGIIGTEQNIQ